MSDNQHQVSQHRPTRGLVQAGWLFYEFANQPYFSLINIFLFANYFANQLAPNALAGQAAWGYTQACAGILIALLSPLFGAIADETGRRKPWIMMFVVLGALGCFGLWFAVPGASLVLVGFSVVIAAIAVELVITFCNALLPDIASGKKVSFLSGFGFGLSQLAGILALIFVLLAFQLPGRVDAALILDQPFLGLDRAAFEHERIVGPVAGIWLVVFMLPLFFWLHEKSNKIFSARQALRAGVARLTTTARKLGQYRNIARFLLARMFYNDGLQAMFAFGGVIAGTILGWGALELALFGVVVTLSAGIGGVLSAFIDARIGSRPTLIIFIIIAIIMAAALASFDRTSVFFVFSFADVAERSGAFTTTGEFIFIALASVFGFAAGPINASSRTLMARMAPKGMEGEFFGLFALSAKATAFAAPLAVALITGFTGNRQLALSVIVVFLVVGLWLFWPVKETRADAL